MVLTDVQMLDTDGFTLLRLLRNLDIGNSKTIPIAVMTAFGDSNTGIYEKEGFVGCIHRSFNIHVLLTFLSSVMFQVKVSDADEFDFIPVYWRIRMIMCICCLWLSINPERKLRTWNQP